jgi:hypothetical protein
LPDKVPDNLGPGMLSQSAFARLIGVSQPTINGYVSRGMAGVVDGLISDPEAAKAWIKETIDPARRASYLRGKAAEPGVAQERGGAGARLLSAQATRIECENALKFGDAIKASTVRERDAVNVRAAKALILSFPGMFRQHLSFHYSKKNLWRIWLTRFYKISLVSHPSSFQIMMKNLFIKIMMKRNMLQLERL